MDLGEKMEKIEKRIAKLEKTLKHITPLWRAPHDNTTLEPLITRAAVDYLNTQFPYHFKIDNVFEEIGITNQWVDPYFCLDNLMYDKTDHVFYIVVSKYNLTAADWAAAVAAVDQFCEFLRMKRPEKNDRSHRALRWTYFFEGNNSLTRGKKTVAAVRVFFGFFTCECKDILDEARSRGWILMGPGEWDKKNVNWPW